MAKVTQAQRQKCTELGIDIKPGYDKAKVEQLILAKKEEIAATQNEDVPVQPETNEDQPQQDKGEKSSGENVDESPFDETSSSDSDNNTDENNEPEDGNDSTDDSDSSLDDEDYDNNSSEDEDNDSSSTPEETVPVSKLGTTEIASLLKKPGVKIEDKLQTILENGNTAYAALVGKLLTYAKDMSRKSPVQTGEIGAAKNYDVYTTIKQVVETKDYNEFRVKFDIVNAVFKLHAEDAYSKFAMPRFDTDWKWGEKSLNTYLILVSLIGGLCSKATRAEKLKTHSVDKALEPSTVELKPTGIENIRKYYAA